MHISQYHLDRMPNCCKIWHKANKCLELKEETDEKEE